MFTRMSHNLAARRPWLLLWVLPYLLLTLAGESLHNHGLSELAKTPPAFQTHSGGASDLGGEHPHSISSDEGCAQRGSAHSLPHCLSCQWSSQSVGVPSVASSADSQLRISFLAPKAERTFASSSIGITSTRGPPLSLNSQTGRTCCAVQRRNLSPCFSRCEYVLVRAIARCHSAVPL
jgi:hypothetical protein